MRDFAETDILNYAKKLYTHSNACPMVDKTPSCANLRFFTVKDVREGLSKLSNGKAADTLHIRAELIKWSNEHTQEYITKLLNQVIESAFPQEWQENWIKPIYKGGDRNQLTNYRTIMVCSTLAKLFSTIVEKKVSGWAEDEHKRAIGQAGFRTKHCTTDHLVTLRVMMEESRLKGKNLYCCFIDFKKAFDTVPRDILWKRMEQIEVPNHLMFAVYRLYERVICQIKYKKGMSEKFYSNMGVKQGCPLSPTLFGLCIDKLEELIREIACEEELVGPTIGSCVILLLLYADDVVFFTDSESNTQRMMDILDIFCSKSGLFVNVAKTKLMVVKTRQPRTPPPSHSMVAEQ